MEPNKQCIANIFDINIIRLSFINGIRTKSPQEKILTLMQVHWFVQPYISEVHLLMQPRILYLHINTVNNS